MISKQMMLIFKLNGFQKSYLEELIAILLLVDKEINQWELLELW